MKKNKTEIRKNGANIIDLSYEKLGLDQLLIYCVKKIIERGEVCTFETLVYECFSLFPEKFSLAHYPEWPDSARVEKSWRRCRSDKGWLSGRAKEGLRITEAGAEIALATEKILFKKTVINKPIKKTMNRTREKAIISYIYDTKEFRKYLLSERYDISDRELRSFLGGTLETPKRILIHNYFRYYQAARRLGEQKVLSFLRLCKIRLKKMGGINGTAADKKNLSRN
ncbi:MAG: hypothetical protein HPY46_02590 [Candidatus Aminicenantes bacterium]|nr:hypothetical protein [Candidatus Aminicenantes bacterium]